MAKGRRRKRGWTGTKLLALALYGLLVAIGIVFLVRVTDGSASQTDKEVFGYLFAAVVLASFAVLIQLLGRGVGKVVIGADKRISTGKLQAVVWTVLIAATILALIAQDWVGVSGGWDELKSFGFDEFGPYLILLGGPFAAAISAKALVSSQVENGDSTKPPGEPHASQAFTNDAGGADLIDCQYLLFNLIALIYFVGAFIDSPGNGLPEIPSFLYMLTGASALGYVSNKAIPSGPPKIESLSPSIVKPDAIRSGARVTVFGEGLLFPLNPTATTAATRLEQYHDVRVKVGGYQATIVEGSLLCSRTGGDRLDILVPDSLEPGNEYDVVALNFRGTPTEPVKLKVEAEPAARRGRSFPGNGRRTRQPVR